MTLDERLTVVVHELQRRATNLETGQFDAAASGRAGGMRFAADMIIAELQDTADDNLWEAA